MESPGGAARSHLRERKVGPALAAEFQLGYSPPQPGLLLKHMLGLNFTTEEIVESGLVHPSCLAKGEHRAIDRLHGRLVIPIRNVLGQVRLERPSPRIQGRQRVEGEAKCAKQSAVLRRGGLQTTHET